MASEVTRILMLHRVLDDRAAGLEHLEVPLDVPADGRDAGHLGELEPVEADGHAVGDLPGP